MDWATFFKDYGQSLFTLGGVFLGSAITFLINWLNLRNQSKERDKDRLEARREARIETSEKWMEREILQLIDAIENLLKLLSDIASLYSRGDSLQKMLNMNLATQDEIRTEGKIVFERATSLRDEVNVILNSMSRLIYSFEEKVILDSYLNLLEDVATFLDQEDFHDLSSVRKTAGALHKVLREKLISIRDIIE